MGTGSLRISAAGDAVGAWRFANSIRTRVSLSNWVTSFWSMKAMRNQPRKMAPMGMATAHAGTMLSLPTVANATVNAVTDTAKKNFGNLLISRSPFVLCSRLLSFQLADFMNAKILWCFELEICSFHFPGARRLFGLKRKIGRHVATLDLDFLCRRRSHGSRFAMICLEGVYAVWHILDGVFPIFS